MSIDSSDSCRSDDKILLNLEESDTTAEKILTVFQNEAQENSSHVKEADLEALKLEIENLTEEKNELQEQLAWLHYKTSKHTKRTEFGSYAFKTETMMNFANAVGSKLTDALYYFETEQGDSPEREIDDTSETSNGEASHKVPDLSFNELKDSVTRVRRGILPFGKLLANIAFLTSWENPIVTINAMVVYFYLVYREKLMCALLILKLTFFSLSFMIKCGYHVTTIFDDPEIEDDPKLDIRDRIKGARKTVFRVQSLAGSVADALEKIISFYQWEDREGGRKMVFVLSFGIFGYLFLPSGLIQKLGLFFLGYLIFVEQPLFKKFPRLKKRFSFAAKVWKRLPNQAQKEQRRVKVSEGYKVHVLPVPATPSSVTPEQRTANPKINQPTTAHLEISSSHNFVPPMTATSPKSVKTLNPNLIKILQMYKITDDPIAEFSDGLGCYYSQGKKNAFFGIPKLISGKIWVTENHLVFCGKFLKKESFIISLEAVTKVELTTGKLDKAHTIEVHTTDEVFNIIVVMSKDKTKELFIWLKTRLRKFSQYTLVSAEDESDTRSLESTESLVDTSRLDSRLHIPDDLFPPEIPSDCETYDFVRK